MKLFCTELLAADGERYVGPDILAEDWPSALREAAARGVVVLGVLVSEGPSGNEVSADDIIHRMLERETKH